MSTHELTRTRKPDRQFYRHPKYNAPVGDPNEQAAPDQKIHIGQDSENVRNVPSNGNVHGRRVSRAHKVRSGFSTSCAFTKSRSHKYSDLSSGKSAAGDGIKMGDDLQENKLPAAELKLPVTTSVDVGPSTCLIPCRDEPSAEKHGGIIHLPKNVDIYNSADEPKTGCSRYTKRMFPAPIKPVVVVRPSFPQGSRQSECETPITLSSNQPGVLKLTNKECSQTWQSDSVAQAKVNKMPAIQWTDAAKVAYEYFLQSLGHVDQERLKLGGFTFPCVDAPLAVDQKQNAPDVVVPNIPAPNEKISTVMQQIVQLDGALNALLIPPGLCARAMPCLCPPPPHPTTGKQWTETQLLIFKWWSAVQRLRERLFNLFESVILADLDFCNTAHVEQGMWKSIFYTVLELLRSWINDPTGTSLIPTNRMTDDSSSAGDRTEVATVLQQICLSDVISAGEQRLAHLLERIQTSHRVQLGPLLMDSRPPPETRSRTRRLVYLSAQKLMLFLGDLARYKELLTGERNFGRARSWYQKAQLLIPKNGRSYNQLAVLAVYTSRHLDAMYYYMRTLAASNPFPTASQSLVALFNEIRPRAENLMRQLHKPKIEVSTTHHTSFGASSSRFQRAEIWIHPIDGQTTVLQGARRLLYLPASKASCLDSQRHTVKTGFNGSVNLDSAVDDDDDEEAQAELEEYANMSLIDLSKQFGLTFIHAHGKLFTKIGMETFPEVASLALQALSGLLAQKPCPLSSERLCQLCIVNMYNVDRAVSLTTHASGLTPSKPKLPDQKGTETDGDLGTLQPICQLGGVETLRSVHHDHAARFALDTFSLLCRRTAQLLQEPSPADVPSWWLPSDARLLLSALRLWSEWMILHPEHWLPPPNHRDPTLRPCLNDWQLVADLCTKAANWLNRNPVRPQYEEVTPTTSLVLRLKDGSNSQDRDDDRSIKVSDLPVSFETTVLFEEAFCAGFKPMLDLMPKLYRYSGNWAAETVADFVRVEKLVLFGDFLCGIDSPVLNYDVERGLYESVIERESSERKEDKQPGSLTDGTYAETRYSSESEPTVSSVQQRDNDLSTVVKSADPLEHETSADIAALQRERALLQRQLEEENRLAAWRLNAIRQAESGGRRAVELEVRPIYLLPDTNCYIDWLEGIATLAQRSSNYTVLVPIVVVNELDTLARYGSSSHANSGKANHAYEEEGEVTRAGLIQERARAAIAYLEHEFAHRNTRLRALTARGSFMETIAYRNEINGGRGPGQVNDDVILTCCNHFCKEDPDRFRSSRGLDQKIPVGQNTQPVRLVREIVLLTSDRNLRLKALNINVPVRPLRTFVHWSRLTIVTTLPAAVVEPVLPSDGRKSEFPKPQPRGQWKQPLRH
ncbi:Telomerase binding protein EST1A [Paragonimus heterotremus]|uniref:Telomerase binding protein EST1A n=1 Tax=Paragonimus heterotremus TaxID=100268 RepID=A0A8J4THR7_9TREM|nr:Telomerase binding protein EST1A [Paragonimus heterotremus]